MTTTPTPDQMFDAIAAQLRAERAAAGLTVADLAERTGLSARRIHDYLNGRATASMPTRALDALARAMGTNSLLIIQAAHERATRQAAL